jgi:DNA-binding NarL/FixJ family response regulator
MPAAHENADVALLDFQLPDERAGAAELDPEFPPGHGDRLPQRRGIGRDLLDAIDAAMAYLTKSAAAEQIVEAVRRAPQGEVLIPAELFAKAIARAARRTSQQALERHDC